MQPEELARMLYVAAERRAATHNLRLGHGADTDIRAFATAAANRLVTDNAAQELRSTLVPNATTAFETLVDHMIVASAELPGYREAHPGIIGEDTLRQALARLCPLFPIC